VLAQIWGHADEPVVGVGHACITWHVAVLLSYLDPAADEQQAGEATGYAAGERGSDITAVRAAGHEHPRREDLLDNELGYRVDHAVRVSGPDGDSPQPGRST
jgi:hypothetical protein